MQKPESLGERLYMIDDFDLNQPERTGTYVLPEERITLIETCASPSMPYIMDGLKRLGVQANDVAYIIVTHVHLDHAGAAGLMMEACPNAKLLVHPRGARHMIDPTKLIQGAQAVYGDKFNELFDPILPVPRERVIAMEDGETLRVGPDRTLTFYDTPGHAKHHMSIHDSLTNGIFTGDTLGVHYRELRRNGVEFYLPSTSPSQFDPEAMIHSKNRIEQLQVDHIYFGHYGTSSNPGEVYKQLEHWLPIFMELGQQVVKDEADFAAASAKLTQDMMHTVRAYLSEAGIPVAHAVYDILQVDMEVCAMGIVDYLLKRIKVTQP